MSANEPLKQSPNRQGLRALSNDSPDKGQDGRRGNRSTVVKCSYRPPSADFFCWKYGVWYNLEDCCYRHALSTFSGCADCEQGAGNLKAQRRRINALRALTCRPLSR